MDTIDEARLESDVSYRYDFVAGFIGFGPEDAAAIQAFAPHLGPRIGELVEATYEKLLAQDATARHFVPPQHGYDGDTPVDLSEVAQDHPQIQFRKDHLTRYFMQLIGRSFDDKMIVYLDMVGKIHTPKAGSRSINVPLVQMNALMGFISDALIGLISESPLDDATRLKTIRAFTRLLWVQNDLITRHYAPESVPALV